MELLDMFPAVSLKRALGALAGILLGISVNAPSSTAATLQFAGDGWEYNTADESDWLVTIDDETANAFRVKISAGSGLSFTPDMLGFGFDTTLTGLTSSSLTFVQSSNGEGITGFFENTLDCGQGCNFNGNGFVGDVFDYIVRMGTQGQTTAVSSFEFLISTSEALAADTFSRVGIRAQLSNGGSVKDYSVTSVYQNQSVVPVPIPAALPLMASVLLLFGFLGWRRRVGGYHSSGAVGCLRP